MPLSKMSERRDDSDFSSAIYVNPTKETRSYRTKSNLTSNECLDLRIKTFQIAVDLKRLYQLLVKQILTLIIVLFIALSIVNGILFFYLYQNQQAILEAVVITNENDEPIVKLPTKGAQQDKKIDMFFWTSQIFDRLTESEEKMKSQISSIMYNVANKITTQLENQQHSNDKITQSFRMILENAGRFEFHTPMLTGSDNIPKVFPKLPTTRPFTIAPTRRTRWPRPGGPPGLSSSRTTAPKETCGGEDIRKCGKSTTPVGIIV